MEAMTDSPTPPPGQATSAIARAIRSICSDGNANPHRVAVDIGGALAHAGFEICTHAEITRLRADVEVFGLDLDARHGGECTVMATACQRAPTISAGLWGHAATRRLPGADPAPGWQALEQQRPGRRVGLAGHFAMRCTVSCRGM